MLSTRGFTIIEIVIALGISAMLFGLSTRGVFQLSQRLRVSPSDTGIIHLLSTAALRSRLGKEESSWGVYFPYDEETRLSDRMILFSGNSYAARDPDDDRSYPLSSTIHFKTVSLSGPLASSGNDHEVIFSPFSGSTENYGSLTLEVYGEEQHILVSKQGFITREYE